MAPCCGEQSCTITSADRPGSSESRLGDLHVWPRRRQHQRHRVLDAADRSRRISAVRHRLSRERGRRRGFLDVFAEHASVDHHRRCDAGGLYRSALMALILSDSVWPSTSSDSFSCSRAASSGGSPNKTGKRAGGESSGASANRSTLGGELALSAQPVLDVVAVLSAASDEVIEGSCRDRLGCRRERGSRRSLQCSRAVC